MAQLDERTRGDLARLRARAAPSEAAKQRMFAALEATLGDDPEGGDDGDDGDDGSDPGDFADLGGASQTGQLAYAAKVVGATLGLTGAGLLALKVGIEIVRAIAAEPASSPGASLESTPSQPVVIAAAPEPTDVEAIAIDPPVEDSLVAAAPARRPRPRVEPAPANADNLAEELALLEAAHAARDPAAALVELENHVARFPNGSLAVERELLRVETLCRLDRLDQARAIAGRLLREHPSSASRKRLSTACGDQWLAPKKN